MEGQREIRQDPLLDSESGIFESILSAGTPVLTTGLVNLAGGDAIQQQLLDQLTSEVPIGRLGRPEEIASATLILASAESSFVNGIELFVDGGAAQV